MADIKIDMTCVDFDLTESVNLRSYKALGRAVPLLLQNGGKLVNLQGHVSEWQRASMLAIESFGPTLDDLA